MKTCQHLNVITQPPIGGMPVNPTTECGLKTHDVGARPVMALDAHNILGVPCPPNIECHYWYHNRCEDCQQHTP